MSDYINPFKEWQVKHNAGRISADRSPWHTNELRCAWNAGAEACARQHLLMEHGKASDEDIAAMMRGIEQEEWT